MHTHSLTPLPSANRIPSDTSGNEAHFYFLLAFVRVFLFRGRRCASSICIYALHDWRCRNLRRRAWDVLEWLYAVAHVSQQRRSTNTHTQQRYSNFVDENKLNALALARRAAAAAQHTRNASRFIIYIPSKCRRINKPTEKNQHFVWLNRKKREEQEREEYGKLRWFFRFLIFSVVRCRVASWLEQHQIAWQFFIHTTEKNLVKFR